MTVWVKTCSTVLRLNSWLMVQGEGIKVPEDMCFPKTIHLTSDALQPRHLPSHLTRGHLSLRDLQFWWEMGTWAAFLTSGQASRTSESESTDVVESHASCLLFLLTLYPLCLVSFVEYKGTEALLMSLLNLKCCSCQSVSLSPWRSPQKTTVLPCCPV